MAKGALLPSLRWIGSISPCLRNRRRREEQSGTAVMEGRRLEAWVTWLLRESKDFDAIHYAGPLETGEAWKATVGLGKAGTSGRHAAFDLALVRATK